MDGRGAGELPRGPLRAAGRARPRPSGPPQPDGGADVRRARPPGEPDRPGRSRAPGRPAGADGDPREGRCGRDHRDPRRLQGGEDQPPPRPDAPAGAASVPPRGLRRGPPRQRGRASSAGADARLGRRDSAPRSRRAGSRGGLRGAAGPRRAARRAGLHHLHVRLDRTPERRRLQPPRSALGLPGEHAAEPRHRPRPDPPRRLAGERTGDHDAPGAPERRGPLPVRHRDGRPPGAPGVDPGRGDHHLPLGSCGLSLSREDLPSRRALPGAAPRPARGRHDPAGGRGALPAPLPPAVPPPDRLFLHRVGDDRDPLPRHHDAARRRARSGRPPGRGPGGPAPRRRRPRGARRRGGRDRGEEPADGPRLLAARRPDPRAIRARSRRGPGPDLQDGGRRPLPAGRPPRAPRPKGLPGEDPRLPRRDRRGGGGAPEAPRRRRRRRRGARFPLGREAPRRLRRLERRATPPARGPRARSRRSSRTTWCRPRSSRSRACR